ncbi:type I-E CRISPR-associated protein Cse2/CasB [Atlantibacter hermannii]|uniref:type I-E CRISPR-associated protein Cse2/CasB n=1 Tax=Atlantibacter hermannii TaxID=565 RepID=UPI0019338047|nr:type I-E CRISPR-associated protein Cse2/CasB [Atlantibacter hermannii]MBL7675588.1 type I-E CRISPR-associated protein Cse2/CasB [Atlantibacter hermannii]
MRTFLTDEHKKTLRTWHSQLENQRGLRASLRRSKTVNEICMSEGFRSLLVQTHSLWKVEHQAWRFTALALVAGLVSQVKSNDERQTFAARAGNKSERKRPLMSELRFARLRAVKTPDALLRQLRRAVMLLGGNVNVVSLAEDVFHWCQEHEDLRTHYRRQQPLTEFIQIRWAMEYYQADDISDLDTENE